MKAALRNYRVTVLVFLVLLVTGYSAVFTTPSHLYAAGLTGFPYSQTISISNTGNTNTLTNYQTLLTLNTQALVSAGQMRNDCGDIRFLDSDNSTQIVNYWIEPSTCNSTATKIWIKIPSITASSNKTIYLYYGNTSATSLSSTANTFIDDISGGVSGAWNLNEGNGTNAYDMSGNTNTGIWQGTLGSQWATGTLGGAGNFNGIDNYIQLTTNPITSPTGNWTISMWIKPTDLSGTGCFFYNKVGGLSICNNGSNLQGLFEDIIWLRTSYTLTTSQWIYVAFTRNSGTNTIYVNGTSVYSDTSIPSTSSYYGSAIGEDSNDGSTSYRVYNGREQNVAIFTTALTQAQITEIYNNYGYTTPNYAGHDLVRQYSSPDPTTSANNASSNVSVTGRVTPQLTLGLSSNSTTFGNLPVGTVSTASPATTLTLSSNTVSGITVSVYDSGSGSSPGLNSTGSNHLIPSSTTTLSSTVEGYGVQASSGSFTVASPFTATGNAVGGLSLSTAPLASIASPIQNGTITINYVSSIVPTTPAGSYQDNVTYVASGKF